VVSPQINLSHARRASVWIAPLIAIIAISVVSTACGGSDVREPLDLVPARASLLASVDLAGVLADEQVEEVYGLIAGADESVPATLTDLLAMGEEKLGVDLSGFRQVILFVDVDSLDEGVDAVEFAGALASTDLKQDELFEGIQANASVQTTEAEYEGVSLLVMDNGDTAAALVDGVVAFGTIDAVHAVIDVARSDAPVITGAVLDFYNELGDVWLKVALTAPDDVADSVGDVGELGLPVDVAALLEINALGVVVTKDETDIVVRIVLRYPTAEAASETEESLIGLLDLMVGLLGDDELTDLANTLDIASVGNDVTIEFRQDVQETLDDLRQSLEENGTAIPFGIGL
jgi:hypothetical protein